MTKEEIKHKLIAKSFNFEDSDGVTHSPWITLADAINIIEHEYNGLVKHPIDMNGEENKSVSYCYNCGTNVKDQKYCHGCGRRLLWNNDER